MLRPSCEVCKTVTVGCLVVAASAIGMLYEVEAIISYRLILDGFTVKICRGVADLLS